MLYVAHLYHWSIITFQHSLQAHWYIWPILAQVQKFCHKQTLGSSICNCSEPFPLPHLCGTGDLPSVASVVQTHDTCSLIGYGQDYRVDRSQVPSETTEITCAWHVLRRVALSCWMITPNARCPGLFLQTASHSHCSISSRHSHWLLCPKAWIQCGWLLRISEHRYHNFSSRLTHFKVFASQRIWVFPVHFSLFCFRHDVMYLYLISCHFGFQELMSFFKSLKITAIKKCWFLCSFIRHLIVYTAPVQWIDLKLWLNGFTKSVPPLMLHLHLPWCSDKTVQWSSWIFLCCMYRAF
jgi:hypothetical protein